MNLRATALLALAMIPFLSCQAQPQTPAPSDSDSNPARQPSAVPAQTGSNAGPPPQSPAPTPAWSVGPIDFTGELSGYYTYNANHPHTQDDNGSSSTETGNNLYNFNARADTPDLSLAMLSVSHSPDPVGFEVDFAFGRTVDVINAAERTGSGFQYVEQAFLDWKPAKAKGFEITLGKFSSTAGAELIEDYSNWNYSHSLLFSWAVPYFFFGGRASLPIGKHFTGGFQLVNGWNNRTDDVNSARTVGLTGALTFTKFTWNVNYHAGPMNQGTSKGFRNLLDTTLFLTPPGRLNGYINFNYGNNANSLCSTCTAPATQASASWYGLATAVHFQITSKWAIAPRFEWFDDADGYELSRILPEPISNLNGAVAQQTKEATITAEYKLLRGLLWRLEWRRDWSTYPMFSRGTPPVSADEGFYASGNGSMSLPLNNPAGLAGYSKFQSTLTIGLIAFFGPTR